ncbi:Gfo/Idh/MocA family oxidoreductase [Paenibacillus cisolokensis]|uniref:Gfo/Idh/MocA family protein n=1 Tax=Paenibacillus cisolokensis TaxID=1658519 RepID=UPI003D2778BD
MRHVLLIGAGTMGSTHAAAYGAMPDVRVAGIVDIRRDQAEAVAGPLGARVFASYEEAAAALERIDVVDVCVPTFLHETYCLKAAADKKDIICEKPLAGSRESALAIMEACRQHGVRLYVGHVLRFFPEYERAKALVEAGAIGEAGVVRTSRVGPFPNAWNDWYADLSKSGGTLLDLIIHDFDFLRWCFGEVERVYAKGLRGRELSRMDYSLVTLRFRSGVIAHVEGSWAHEAFTMRFEIAGRSGIIDYDSGKDKPLVVHTRGGRQGAQGVSVPESPLHRNPYYRELRHFIDCMETGREPLVTAEDALAAVDIALMAAESLRTGQPVYNNRTEVRR